jgi:hydroxypyruvate reductase
MTARPEWNDRQAHVAALCRAALAAVEPGAAVRLVLRREGEHLVVAGRRYDLSANRRVFVVGGGKAAAPMAAATAGILGDRLAGGIVTTKVGHVLSDGSVLGSKVRLLEAGHPVPDEAGVRGAEQMAMLLEQAGEDDLVICLISGGGSALLTSPQPGIALDDLRALTDALLRCGATINEINALRKHLQRLQGGGIARLAAPATVVALILSDVVGDPLDVIASGPTSPDTTSYGDAWAVLERYNLVEAAPHPIVEHLQAGREGRIADTPKPGDPLFERVQNVVIGSNALAAQAAIARARELGFAALLLSTFVEGEAREVARVAAALAKDMARNGRPVIPPACLILGGETTVTIRGNGRGGRNQELALAAAVALDGWPHVLVATLATDGNDGPTDAAGAVATGETVAEGRALGLDARAYLANNDAYTYFDRLGALIRTGPTNTNVNDLLFILAYGP